MGFQEIKDKFLTTIVIIVLLGLVIYLLYDKQHNRQEVETNFRDSIRVLNSKIQDKFVENKNILAYVDSVEHENARLNGKRYAIKTEWRDRYLEAKASPCDTNKLADLNNLHLESELIADTAIFNRDIIIDKLQEVVSNDSVIVQVKDSIIDLYSTAYVELEEKADRDKKKAFRNGFKWGFGTGFVSGLLTGSIFKAKQ